MSISRSEILREKKAEEETEVEKLPSVKVLESVSQGHCQKHLVSLGV